jgi:hypothetical protein
MARIRRSQLGRARTRLVAAFRTLRDPRAIDVQIAQRGRVGT